MQHGTGNGAAKGTCQQFQNPLDSQAVQRALFTALDKWVTAGTPPPPSQVPEAFRWNAREARSDLHRIPSHTRRHLFGSQNHTVSAELRAGLLQDGNSDDQSARHSAALPGQSGELARSTRALCPRRMRMATISPAFACRKSRCRSRLTRAGRFAPGRRTTMDVRAGPIHSVSENQSGPACQWRSALVDRRALRKYGDLFLHAAESDR